MDVMRLAQHIMTLEPAKDTARLCFYNYLRNMCDAGSADVDQLNGQLVTSALLNSFYSRALTFSHWQQNKAHLVAETQSCLLSFAGSNPDFSEAIFKEMQMSWQNDDIETIPIANSKNLSALVARSLEKELSPQEQCRILFDRLGNAIAIALNGSRQAQSQLRIFSFQPVAKLIKGELSPISSEMVLSYGRDLQLAPNVVQQVDVGSHTIARFRVGDDGCRGYLLRGYTFQKYAVMEGGSLHRYPIVFYPIKRMEQFFIDRKTDPMYMELTQILEKATELLGHGHPDAVKFAKQALERGQLALEQIFPDDKLVHLLITNLEKTLRLSPLRALAETTVKVERSSAAYPAGAWAGDETPAAGLVDLTSGPNETGEKQWQTKTNQSMDL